MGGCVEEKNHIIFHLLLKSTEKINWINVRFCKSAVMSVFLHPVYVRTISPVSRTARSDGCYGNWARFVPVLMGTTYNMEQNKQTTTLKHFSNAKQALNGKIQHSCSIFNTHLSDELWMRSAGSPRTCIAIHFSARVRDHTLLKPRFAAKLRIVVLANGRMFHLEDEKEVLKMPLWFISRKYEKNEPS